MTQENDRPTDRILDHDRSIASLRIASLDRSIDERDRANARENALRTKITKKLKKSIRARHRRALALARERMKK